MLSSRCVKSIYDEQDLFTADTQAQGGGALDIQLTDLNCEHGNTEVTYHNSLIIEQDISVVEQQLFPSEQIFTESNQQCDSDGL